MYGVGNGDGGKMTEHELYFVQLEAQRNAMRRAKRQLWMAGLSVWLVLTGIAIVYLGIMELLR